MSNSLLCIQSHFGDLPMLFKLAQQRGDAVIISQTELTKQHLQDATGLITTMHLDQLNMMDFSSELEAFLSRGGRWFFNGHIMRPLVFNLKNYIPIRAAGKNDLALTALEKHMVFNAVDRSMLGVRKGVAGFYGRGYNPMPKGATVITGVGDDKAPLDWHWNCPKGGQIFSHAGNDLQSVAETKATSQILAKNIIKWVASEETTVEEKS